MLVRRPENFEALHRSEPGVSRGNRAFGKPLQSVSGRFTPLSHTPFLSLRPKTGCVLLGWRNTCVEALGLPAETRAGTRCPEIAEMGLWGGGRRIHYSSQFPAGQATRSRLSPLPPEGCGFARTRCTPFGEPAQMRPALHEGKSPRHYSPAREILRFRLYACLYESYWKFDGMPGGLASPSTAVKQSEARSRQHEKHSCRDAFRWLRTPNDVDVGFSSREAVSAAFARLGASPVIDSPQRG